jgi:formate dehydrogenase subunit beta
MAEAFSWSIKKGEDHQDTLRRLLREALEQDVVDAVLCPVEDRSGSGVSYVLTMDPKHLERAVPISRALPQFGPQDLVHLTEPGGDPIRIAAVMKPCESRAVVELMKLKQVEQEHLVLMAPDCPGTVDLEDYARHKNTPVEKLPLRLACQICRSRVAPSAVDVALGTLGVDSGEVLLVAHSEAGSALAKGVKAKATEVSKKRAKAVEQALVEGETAYDKQEAASREKYGEHGVLIEALSTCIKCMNCMDVCPVCYCKECLFLTDAFNPTAGTLAEKARRRGVIRMPVETVQFHLTRMAHVMTACVMCGQCESACPSGIPLVEMYSGINRRIQDLFEYESGRSLEEQPPFTVFCETEAFGSGEG